VPEMHFLFVNTHNDTQNRLVNAGNDRLFRGVMEGYTPGGERPVVTKFKYFKFLVFDVHKPLPCKDNIERSLIRTFLRLRFLFIICYVNLNSNNIQSSI
jgi:hypothetical protein